VRVCAAGHDVTRLHAYRKPLALLAILALERTVPRERAVALLWAESPAEKARHSLSQALLQLKREIAAGDWLDTGRDAIAVSGDVACDAIAFEKAIDTGDFARAVNLYRGAFLDGFDARVAAFEQWAGRRSAHFAVRLRDAVRQLIGMSVARDHVAEALGWARRWVATAGEEDEAQHRLIELLAATGRRSEALEHYELYRRSLLPEGLTPLEETTALVERIRRGESLGPLTTMVRNDAARAAALRTRRLGSRTPDGPRLVRIADGGIEAESYFLGPGVTRLGRAGCEIVFPFDALLEDTHASIDLTPGAAGDVPRLVLRDESRSGGVYLRIRDSWPLRHGDRFRVGQQQFRFEHVGVDVAP
jgi:DNA-binding SARP family transcriptional activator